MIGLVRTAASRDRLTRIWPIGAGTSVRFLTLVRDFFWPSCGREFGRVGLSYAAAFQPSR